MENMQILEPKIKELQNQLAQMQKEKLLSSLDKDCKLDKISKLWQDLNSIIDDLKNLQEEIHKEIEPLQGQILDSTNKLDITNHRLNFRKNERQKIQDKLAFLTYYDAVTGLPNRLLLMDRLNQAILGASRQKTLISLMFINLDGFKVINNILGRNQGDKLLNQVATRLLSIVRKSDSVCRIDGDEFVLFFKNYTHENNLNMIASKVIDVFKKPFVLENQEYFITASIGISQYPEDGRDGETLIKNAEIAMYKAKSLGGNQYNKSSSDLKNSILENVSLTNGLYNAIEQDEMMLYYQPQIDGVTGNIIGAEALLRWNHPDFGFVPPFKFIPLAEKTRLILPIGYWVLKTACEQFNRWQDKGLQPIKLSVNFSVHQLNYSGIIDQIKDVLEESSLEAKYLEIEVTESISMDNKNNILDTLEKIKDLGISLSIDDFGKEYSSLNRLKELPIDTVKIDMSFIQSIGASYKDEAIIKSILLLTSNLGLKTIAEGVETQEQKEFLNKSMCTQLQGYYFYRPMPSVKMEELLVEKFN